MRLHSRGTGRCLKNYETGSDNEKQKQQNCNCTVSVASKQDNIYDYI